ncbi:MAG: thiolase family protein [Dehalococcoidia bacterium]
MAEWIPADFYRTTEGLGIWPYRGQVAAVGIGHAPTSRRWDERPETSVGALAIDAIRKAIDDAGVAPADIDGIVICPDTTTGSWWPEGKPLPQDFLDMFEQTDDPFDGLTKLSSEWLVKNVPELTGIKYLRHGPLCTSMALTGAIESVGRGLTGTCLVVKGWHNFAGRYYQGGHNAIDTVEGPGKYGMALAGPASYSTAMVFQRYLHKYGKTHDMMAPFISNSRRNGLLFPEGYWAQHRPELISRDDYVNARWIAKPANLFDNDLPIHTAAAYVLTTAERARSMKQKPVYVLGHAGAGSSNGVTNASVKSRSVIATLEETEATSAATGRKLFEAAGIQASDMDFENMYDGFSLFHVHHIEGINFAGIKQGEALDLFQDDITIEGPNPVSPSGGNIGGGRTRFWNHTDSIQQLQGRAGARQMTKKVEVGISGGFVPMWNNFVIWSSSPD